MFDKLYKKVRYKLGICRYSSPIHFVTIWGQDCGRSKERGVYKPHSEEY